MEKNVDRKKKRKGKDWEKKNNGTEGMGKEWKVKNGLVVK